MKFGQLIEDNTKNLFLEKSCARYVEETSARHFLKNKKKRCHIPGSTVNSFIQFVFVICPYRGLKHIETKVLTY